MFTVSDDRMRHITVGDATGGGHMHGSADPTKSKFPVGWDAPRIKTEILAVANDAASVVTVQPNLRRKIKGASGGIAITVIALGNSDVIWTAYPT